MRTIGLVPYRFDTMQQTKVHNNNNTQKMKAGLNFSFATSIHNFAPK